ncbi:MAG: triacylglycerol lipase, partial [Nocardioidaceae bacterium]|nr:triacylglycerol lipase [Nocardioidaceae bacterium]
SRIVGVAEGGVLVDPAHNLRYVSGSVGWSAVIPLALIGIARGYGISMKPYLSKYGARLERKLQYADFTDAFFGYPGLTWRKLVKPKYADPNSVK